MSSDSRFAGARRHILAALLMVAGALGGGCARSSNQAGHDLFLVEPAADPMEGFNRGVFKATDGFLYYVARPVTKGYREIAPEGFRKSIAKFGTNLQFPGRFVNTALQGKFKGSAQEAERFAVNTTVGMLGFFDPATRMGIPIYREDFGQTFGAWGAGPGPYVFIPPYFAPSTFRDSVGAVGDVLLNPATYIPGAGLFLGMNNFTFRVDNYEQLSETESDPYSMLRDFWSINRRKDVVDYRTPAAERNQKPEPSLMAVFLTIDSLSPQLALHEKKREVRVPGHSKPMPYSLWLQPEPAPLVFILPGQGGNHNGGVSVSLAEMARRQGLNVVTISSPFAVEFLDGAAMNPVPGYAPEDAEAAHAVMRVIYDELKQKYGDRIGDPLLLGASLGGMHTLYLAATESQRANAIPFKRYVAINPPIDLPYASSQLDAYYDAPNAWPAAERGEHVWKTLMKGAELFSDPPSPGQGLPFDQTESRFIIGLIYRQTLRNTIYETQQRHDLGIIKTPTGWMSREPRYREISAYSYADYLNKFVAPWYEGKMGLSRDELNRRAGLRWLEEGLAANPKVRVIMNANDFINRPEDQEWLAKTVGDHATTFPDGGHMGNLYLPEVQSKVIGALKY